MKTSLLIRRTQDFLSTRPWAAVLAVFLFTGPLPRALPSDVVLAGEPRSGSTVWGPWSFDWEVKNWAALGIRNVYYKHKLVIYQANMPVIRVRYVPGEPGPFADRIRWIDLTNSVKVCDVTHSLGKLYQKSYWVGGRQWLQIGALAKLGEYRLHPGWLLSEDGYIRPFLGGAGLQGNANHIHHPYWRIDFDVNGAASDQVFVYDNTRPNEGWGPGWHKYTVETNAVKNPPTARRWYVRDNPTGHGVWILPGSNDGFAESFSQFDVGPRLHHFPVESVPWPTGASHFADFGEHEYIGYANGENIAEKDIVFWYVSHMFHDWTDSGCKWHYTGPTFKVQ